MTEIPEHLLARSAKRRQEMTGEGDDAAPAASDAAPAKATAAAAEPATAALAPIEPAEPPPEEPVKPWVHAQTARQKIPVWVVPVLVFLPVWFGIYFATLEAPTVEATGPLALGEEVYAGAGNCAGCHGAGGGGGSAPGLNGGEVLLTFPDWQSHAAWVINGAPDGTGVPYGDPARPGGERLSNATMPGYLETLESDELLSVVMYERIQHGEQPIEELADLEAVILAIEEGEATVEFEEGMTGEDVAAMVGELDIETEETAAGE